MAFYLQIFSKLQKFRFILKKVITIANVLFDTGSNRTYVSSDFVQKAQPEIIGCEPVSYVSFG